MKLIVLHGAFAIARLDPSEPIPSWATRGTLWSITRSAEELSLVCRAADVPVGVMAEREWRAFRVAGRLDFALTGVLAALAVPLAAAQVSIFAVSTYDTDYLLVPELRLPEAIGCLRAAGHEVLDE